MRKKENGLTSNFLSETIFLSSHYAPKGGGHFAPEVGRVMEDEFAVLIERLGFRVDRKRDEKSRLDIIAHFHGEPINPKPPYECNLLKPFFSPDGITAFSLKRGDFTPGDVDELLKGIEKTRSFKEEIYKSLKGASIVTNYTKTEEKLDDLLAKSVYCWDGRRLIFYAAKARCILELAFKGPLIEETIEGLDKASYLTQTQTGTGSILVNIVILIDDHSRNFAMGHDDVQLMLKHVYEKSLKPMVDKTRLDIQVAFKFHILGIADKAVVENAYVDYARKGENHPKVVFSQPFAMFQYGAAPWATLLTSSSWI